MRNYKWFATVVFSLCYGRDIVPQRVICGKCGALLYEGEELKPLNDIISDYDGECPNCHEKLSYIPKKVEIKAADATNQLSRLSKRKRR